MKLPENDKIFFILGYQRSGTTWIATLLNHHPEIHCDGEGHFFCGDDNRLFLPEALTASKPFRLWATAHYNLWTKHQSFEKDAVLYAGAIARTIFSQAMGNKKFVGDKSGLAGGRSVCSIYEMFPGSKIIHIIRDPRDVAVSKCFHLWKGVLDGGAVLPEEQEKIRKDYLNAPEQFGASGKSIFHPDFLQAFAREWVEWIPATRKEGRQQFRDNYIEVFYENLSEDPIHALKSVLKFLGASTGDAILKHCVESSSFEWQSGRKRGEVLAFSYFRKGIPGDWRNYFTEEYLKIFGKIANSAMQEMGYSF